MNADKIKRFIDVLISSIQSKTSKMMKSLEGNTFRYIFVIEGQDVVVSIETNLRDTKTSFKDKLELGDTNIIDKNTLFLIIKPTAVENILNENSNLVEEIIKGNIRLIGNVKILMNL